MDDLERQHDESFAYYVDSDEISKVEGYLAYLISPQGFGVVGKNVLEGLVGFQAFFLCNIFGWRFKRTLKNIVIGMLRFLFAVKIVRLGSLR